MYRRLNARQESGPHVYTFSAKIERRSQSLAVCKTSRSNERDGQRLPRPGKQDEVRDVRLSDMASTLESINTQEVDTKLNSTLCMPYGRALVQDDAWWTRSLELLDHWAWTIACRLNYAYTLFDHNPRVGRVVWWVQGGKKSNVYAERFLSHSLAASDFLSQVFRRRLCESCELGRSDLRRTVEGIRTNVRYRGHPHCSLHSPALRNLPIAYHLVLPGLVVR